MIATAQQAPTRPETLEEIIPLCCRERDAKRFRAAVHNLEKFYGVPLSISEVNADLLSRWETWKRDRGDSWHTVQTYLSKVRVLWRKAHRLEFIDSSPDHKPVQASVPGAGHVEPTEWHVRPPNTSDEKCPICGCGQNVRGEHRAMKRSERSSRRWLMRRDGPDGKETIECGAKWNRTAARLSPGPSRRVLNGISQAAALQALGKTYDEISQAMGVEKRTVIEWRARHHALWNKAIETAMANVVEMVRQQAGTEAVLRDPAGFLAAAEVADRWATARGEKLFPVFEGQAGQTLSQFYAGYYRPRRLSDAMPSTLYNHQGILKTWRYITGDPPLERITPQLLVAYRDALSALPGQSAGSRMSPNSIRSKLRFIQTLLDKAGPPGPRNRDGAGILKQPPWAQPPRALHKVPRIVEEDALNAVYLAAASATRPRIEGVKPVDWWRALLVLIYNTGIRRRSLLSLRMTDVDWETATLVIRPENIKTRVGQKFHLNRITLDHLQAIRGPRELVFEMPFCLSVFRKTFLKIQLSAGLPWGKHFGLHALRRTAATALWETSPQAAQLLLGHASMRTTQQFYVAGSGIVARAMDAMPQPSAFTSAGRVLATEGGVA